MNAYIELCWFHVANVLLNFGKIQPEYVENAKGFYICTQTIEYICSNKTTQLSTYSTYYYNYKQWNTTKGKGDYQCPEFMKCPIPQDLLALFNHSATENY